MSYIFKALRRRQFQVVGDMSEISVLIVLIPVLIVLIPVIIVDYVICSLMSASNVPYFLVFIPRIFMRE